MKPLILAVALVIAALVIFGANRFSLKPTLTTTTTQPVTTTLPSITTTTQRVTTTTLAITGSVVEQQALSELENELEQAVANITVEDVEQALTQ